MTSARSSSWSCPTSTVCRSQRVAGGFLCGAGERCLPLHLFLGNSKLARDELLLVAGCALEGYGCASGSGKVEKLYGRNFMDVSIFFLVCGVGQPC